jgi:hypothetical protein
MIESRDGIASKVSQYDNRGGAGKRGQSIPASFAAGLSRTGEGSRREKSRGIPSDGQSLRYDGGSITQGEKEHGYRNSH